MARVLIGMKWKTAVKYVRIYDLWSLVILIDRKFITNCSIDVEITYMTTRFAFAECCCRSSLSFIWRKVFAFRASNSLSSMKGSVFGYKNWSLIECLIHINHLGGINYLPVELISEVSLSLRIRSCVRASNHVLVAVDGGAVISEMTTTSWMGMRNLFNNCRILFHQKRSQLLPHLFVMIL